MKITVKQADPAQLLEGLTVMFSQHLPDASATHMGVVGHVSNWTGDQELKTPDYIADREHIVTFVSDEDKTEYRLRVQDMLALGAKAYQTMKGYKLEKVSLDLSWLQRSELVEAFSAAFMRGFALGYFDMKDLYKSYKHRLGFMEGHELSVLVNSAHMISITMPEIQRHLESLVDVCYYEAEARFLTNLPGSELTPENFRQHFREEALNPSILWARRGDRKGDDWVIKKEDFAGLRAVGEGSTNKSVAMFLEHKPEGATGTPIVLVGKGVTFDTGGTSLKANDDDLWQMRGDMSGAAVIACTVEALRKLGVKRHVVGLALLTENRLSSNSLLPGDVIKYPNDKTVEVADTDAEGRLILADGLCYPWKQFFGEDYIIIDVATLTGSVETSLGVKTTGLFSNNGDLALALKQAAEAVGDSVYQLPLLDCEREAIKGTFTDLVNWTGKPDAIRASLFLEQFLEPGAKWAHLDIAGTHLCVSDWGPYKKGATGWGVQLLVNYITNS